MGQGSQLTLFIGLFLAIYVIFALPFYEMGKKTGSDNPWYAFVPILNLVLWCEIAGKEWWWILLLFIPCVNVVASVILWMSTAEAMNKPSWLGVLMLVPGVNIVLPFYLAYG